MNSNNVKIEITNLNLTYNLNRLFIMDKKKVDNIERMVGSKTDLLTSNWGTKYLKILNADKMCK